MWCIFIVTHCILCGYDCLCMCACMRVCCMCYVVWYVSVYICKKICSMHWILDPTIIRTYTTNTPHPQTHIYTPHVLTTHTRTPNTPHPLTHTNTLIPHTHTHTHTRTHAHTHTRTHAHTHTRTHAHTHTRTHAHTHTRTHAHTHTRTHSHTRKRAHAHTRTRTHARTHAHTEVIVSLFSADPQDLVLVGVHVSPRDAVAEINALDNVRRAMRYKFKQEDILIMGDFNADCSYVSNAESSKLKLRDRKYRWWIGNDVDTTVGRSDCAYDR